MIPNVPTKATNDTLSAVEANSIVNAIKSKGQNPAVAFNPQFRNQYNLKEWGAVGDGVTDDGPVIQALINTVDANGGGDIIADDAIYQVNSALVNGNQISIPFRSHAQSQTATSVRIIGNTPPNMFTDAFEGGDPPETGAIFRSGLVGAGNVFGSAPGADFNFVHPYLKHITVRVNSKNGATDIAPMATAINFSSCAYCTIDGVMVDTTSNRGSTVMPASTAYGVRLPATGNYAAVHVDKNFVTGFYTAFDIYECASLTNVFVDGCYKGLKFNTSNHPAFVSKCFISRTAIDIEAAGAMPFYIDQLGLETTELGNWFDNQYNLLESAPGSIGFIKYNKVISGVGFNNSIFKRDSYGPSGIKVESINYSAKTETYNIQTGNYTLTDFDREQTVVMNSSNPVNLTIPVGLAISVGVKIPVQQAGVGNISVLAAEDVTINSYQNYNTTGGQFSKIYLEQNGLNTWLISGDLTSGSTISTNTEVTNYATAAEVTNQGYINAMNIAVTQIKNLGKWANVVALYPFLGSDAAHSIYSLKDYTTYALTAHGTGVFAGNGYTPDGSTGYLDTGIVPTAVLNQNSTAYVYYNPTDVGQTGFYAGSYSAGNTAGIFLAPNDGGANYSNINGTGSGFPVPVNTKGLYILNRSSSSQSSYVKDGVVTTITDNSLGQSSNSVVIGGLHRDGGVINSFSAAPCGFFMICDGLTTDEITDITNIVNNLMTALGRS